jgi:hypothetical protein
MSDSGSVTQVLALCFVVNTFNVLGSGPSSASFGSPGSRKPCAAYRCQYKADCLWVGASFRSVLNGVKGDGISSDWIAFGTGNKSGGNETFAFFGAIDEIVKPELICDNLSIDKINDLHNPATSRASSKTGNIMAFYTIPELLSYLSYHKN